MINANKQPAPEPKANSMFVAPSPPRKSLKALPIPAPREQPKKPDCSFLGSFFSNDTPNNAPLNITALSIIPKTIYSIIYISPLFCNYTKQMRRNCVQPVRPGVAPCALFITQ